MTATAIRRGFGREAAAGAAGRARPSRVIARRGAPPSKGKNRPLRRRMFLARVRPELHARPDPGIVRLKRGKTGQSTSDEHRTRSRRARLWRDQGKRELTIFSPPSMVGSRRANAILPACYPPLGSRPPRSGPERSDFERWQCRAGRAGLFRLPSHLRRSRSRPASSALRRLRPWNGLRHPASGGRRRRKAARSFASHPAKSIGRTLGSQRRKRSVGAHQTSSGCNRSISFQSKPHR